MRKEFIKELIREVYGPREGVKEEINQDPWDDYLTGVIIPRDWKLKEDEGNPEPDSDLIRSGEDLKLEDEVSDQDVDQIFPSELDPKMKPKSFGISFVTGMNPIIDICFTWGRYFEEKSDENIIWNRKSYSDIVEINFNEADHDKIILENEENDGEIILNIRKVDIAGDKCHLTISIENNLNFEALKSEYRPNTSACIFQPSLRINLKDNTELVESAPTSSHEKELRFIYRNRPVKATGHMCSAVWKDIDYIDEFGEGIWIDGKENKKIEEFKRPDVRSEFVPLYPMPVPSFDISQVDNSKFLASNLAESYHPDKLDEFLRPILASYTEWINSNKGRIKELDHNQKEVARELLKKQEESLKRMEKGLTILKEHEDARLAFCFANKTIDIQNRFGNKNKKLVEQDKKDEFDKNFCWRPFQLAFFLMNIESIYNKQSKDRKTLDLLWIPTGGGKTESYLGIMAFTIALRRIKSTKSSKKDSRSGTTIMSRYTLRLLTVQQFLRTLKMITAAEYLRVYTCSNGSIGWRPKAIEDENDWIYGSSRFSTGIWVGSAVSPNHLIKNGGAMASLMQKDNINVEGEPAQVLKCPSCNAWLSIPESGLPKTDSNLHLVVNGNFEDDELTSYIKENIEIIDSIIISNENHVNEYKTISFRFIDDINIEEQLIEDIWDKFSNKFGIKIASLSLKRPGYFGSVKEIGRTGPKKNECRDFEIWCPNPKCCLNDSFWKEGIPINENDELEEFPDGLFERKIISPFIAGTRIPIPAYTIDEQIYSRCPTVIVSTADKIARLAFEPRVANIFGNVNRFNFYYGYHRDNLYPDDTTKRCRENDMEINYFKPPDLIIQDELHLIDGPLGSMFGLYETITQSLIQKLDGNPKYIASTATIKNAKEQVRKLFGKDLLQFPPYGLSIEDSFFVHESSPETAWDEEKFGRVYLGVYSPGRGPMTPLVRIWSRVLKTSNDLKNNDPTDENIKYFWTLVGYYNAIRELGGGIALFREDIEEQLKNISKRCPDDERRSLDHNRIIELSSRINSAEVPLKLSEIERDGKGNGVPSYDAIFTTSMFGTGVDIAHLSLMIVNGQPKTTGSYIQATGRIGRAHGGLVVTFLRAGRPRDLSHYEMFTSYHSRIHMGVEPVSVSPFSKGALERGLGPAVVSFLRNAYGLESKWYDKDGRAIITRKNAKKDIKEIFNLFKIRLEDIYGNDEDKISSLLIYFKAQIDKWENAALRNEILLFDEYNPFVEPESSVVLGDPPHERKENLETVYKNAPTSLREIEETTGFLV